MPENKPVIMYFDTEQGDYDCHNTIARIKRMAGHLTNVYAFSLRQFSPMERCQIIEFAFKKYGDKTAFCVIDGIADLAIGINEEDEATRVSTMLLRLTKVYNCHITTVIHQNKNDNFATGHLGSAIMKKSEIILSIVKDPVNTAYSEVNCDLSRGIDFAKFQFMVNGDGIPEVVTNGSAKRVEQTDWFGSKNDREDVPF
jgi:KaiC/GvpD/RAD55 family RecA-like ATPase